MVPKGNGDPPGPCSPSIFPVSLPIKGVFFSEGAEEMSKLRAHKPKIFLKLKIVIFLHLSD
jgi:hypothetical protein